MTRRVHHAPRPGHHVPRRAAVLAPLLVAALLATACSSGGSGAADRPRTPATLQITVPEPNATVANPVTVRVDLANARLVPGSGIGGKVRPHQGHVHVSVDGKLVAMVNRDQVDLGTLAPGQHTVQAEFVASDHLPFANRVVAAVTFTVS
jgi:hypothetical protein